MNTKDVCRELSITPKTLRVYETQKLISPAREENGYRNYSIDDIMKIQVIMMLRDLGFSLKEIRSVLHFEKADDEFLHSFYIQSKAIESKINELGRTKDRLNNAVNELLRADRGDARILETIFRTARPENDKTTYQVMVDRWNFDLMAVDYVNRYLKEDTAYLNAIKTVEGLVKKYPHGTRILDVGGGTCNLWIGFSPNTQLTVMDKSLPMILAARENAPWACFVLGDLLHLDPGKYEPFDLVLSTFTLHHVPYEKQLNAYQNLILAAGPAGSVLIVDRSFRDQAERDAKEKMLVETNDLPALDIFRSEFYLIVDDVVRFVRGLGCRIEAFPVEENIWGYQILKF